MENAKVALFEDDPGMIESARYFIALAGHSVVAEATSRSEALEVIGQIANGELAVDVAVVDANLTAPLGARGDDGRAVVNALRSTAPSVKTIGFSSLPMAAYGIEVNTDLSKSKFMLLGKTINEL